MGRRRGQGDQRPGGRSSPAAHPGEPEERPLLSRREPGLRTQGPTLVPSAAPSWPRLPPSFWRVDLEWRRFPLLLALPRSGFNTCANVAAERSRKKRDAESRRRSSSDPSRGTHPRRHQHAKAGVS